MKKVKTMNLLAKIRRLAFTMTALLFVVGIAGAQTQPQLVPLFFTGLAGGDTADGRRVLLRWEAVDGIVDLENSVIFRTDASQQREKLSVVRSTRNTQLIQSIFFRPGEQRILEAARETLERVYGTSGNTPQEFVKLAIDLLEGRDQTEYASFRRNFLVQSNYGFAIVDGRAYLDFVDPAKGPFVYELWQGDANGDPVDALGRITIDANDVAPLPAPASLTEVYLRGRDGVSPARANHRRIYLNFEVGADLRKYSTTMFGYNIYKLPRALVAGETFASVQGELERLNHLPILEPSPIEGEAPDQTYVYVDDGDWLETGSEDDLLTVGDSAVYWAVARDLLANEGMPTAPLETTVRDTFEPEAPRGIGVFQDTDPNRVPFMHVQWDIQTEDTVAFRIYRYRQYGNAGQKGPFAPIDGMTEGFIGDVIPPLPAQDQIKFDYEDYDANQAARGTGFWYCVSALDASGNESALSPPMYGVIDDVVGPAPGRITEFCIARPMLTASVVLDTDLRSISTDWTPRFVLRRTHPAIVRVKISRYYPIPQKGVADEIPVASLEFGEVDALEFFETIPAITDQDGVPYYRFTFEDATGGSADAVAGPPAVWSIGNDRIVYRATGRADRFTKVCDPFGSGELKPGPVTVYPGENIAPFEISVGCDGETVQWRLYRSVDGGSNYQLVKEVSCSDSPGLPLTDDFHPESLAEVLYSIVPVDKHGNLGAPRYLEPVFVYSAKIPTPTMVSVDAIGQQANASIRLRWIGPRAGVQFYRIRFLDGENTERRWLEFPVKELTFDPDDNEFEVLVNAIDRDNTPIDPNANYSIEVEAVTLASTSKSSNQLPISWASKALNAGPSGTFRWNARPLPPSYPLNGYISFFSDYKGVMIQILETGGQEAGIEFTRTPPFPFMVWRQRTDKTGQPWIAVSPLLTEVNFSGQLLNDGFFRRVPYPLPDSKERLFFLDNSGHVQGATYRYLFMVFDPANGEIDKLYGPISTTILIPG